MNFTSLLRMGFAALVFPAFVCAAEEAPATVKTFTSKDKAYRFTVDATRSPDLMPWLEKDLMPDVELWYPKMVAMMPSEGYTAPAEVFMEFKSDMGGTPAYAAGNRISLSIPFFKSQLNNEAKGCVIHELVHVIQNFGLARRNRQATPTPGWVTEGLADYIRWFLYEPEKNGARITGRNIGSARHDGSYRISANFIDWVVRNHDKDLLRELNAAAREGRYQENLWEKRTGKPLAALSTEWKASLSKPVAAKTEAAHNSLTDAEKAAGWKLLFNGVDLAGWHNFKRDDIRPGWQVKDGALVCVDPHDAGDIVTTEQFSAFELQLDYNISEGGNSGIIFHVTDEGGAVWATGPEFQLEDNANAADPQRCGWLYALYQPANDPKTGKPIDATKPAGEWNHVRLVISPEKCEHFINGVKYFEYVMSSEDFKARVAKSKFGNMPLFAKSGSGYLALQGDHGQVSFRNIKVRSLAK